MAIVYCDLVNGIDWYTQAVYAAGTTYAQDALVIPSAASGLTSVTARVWKSLQNANTGNALEEGVWWTLVADGSRTKPWLTIGDSTRGLTAGDTVRLMKSPRIALTGSYTFSYSTGNCTVSGNNPDDLAIGDLIGDDNILWWKIATITYSDTITTITFAGPTNTSKKFVSPSLANETPATTYKYTPISMTNTIINSSGSLFNYIKLQGGWDTISDFQNGYTVIGGFIDGRKRSCIDFSNIISIIDLNRHDGTRNVRYTNCICTAGGTLDNLSGGESELYNCCGIGGGTLISYTTLTPPTSYKLKNCKTMHGWMGSADSGTIHAEDCVFIELESGLNATNSTKPTHMHLTNCTISTASLYSLFYFANTTDFPAFIFENCTTNISRTVSTVGNYGRYYFQNRNGIVGDHRIEMVPGTIISDAITRHTASGLAWRFEPNINATSTYLLDFLTPENEHPFQVAVNANQLVIATIWCKKSSSDAGFEARFICKGGQLAGIPNDVTAVADDSTDWQQLTIQVTPTETGVLRFGFQVWGSSTATCHIDDFGVTQ